MSKNRNDKIIEELKNHIKEKYGNRARAGIVLYHSEKTNEIMLSSMFSLNMSLLQDIIEKYRGLKQCIQ